MLLSKHLRAPQGRQVRLVRVEVAGLLLLAAVGCSKAPPDPAYSLVEPSALPTAAQVASTPCGLERTSLGRAPAALYGAASAATNEALWLVSGSSRPDKFGSTLWRYDGTWTVVETSQPLVPRRYATATFVEGELLIVGGYGAEGLSPDVERVNVATGEVTLGSPLPRLRYFHGAAAFGQELWVAGGHTSSGGRPSASVWIYDPALDTWEEGAPLSEGRDTQLVVSDGSVLALGGLAGTEPSGLIEQSRGGAWSSMGRVSHPVSAYAAASTKSGVFLFGDYENHGAVSVLHQGDLMPVDVEYTPRRHATAAVMGESIVVIGGNTASSGSWLDTVETYVLRCDK